MKAFNKANFLCIISAYFLLSIQLVYCVRNSSKRVYRDSQSGSNNTIEDTDGRTQLHYAAENGNIAEIQSILETPYGILLLDMQDNKGCTALFLAVQQLHTEAIKLLLEYGANMLCPNKSNQTPLEFILNDYWRANPLLAISQQYYETLRLLCTTFVEKFDNTDLTIAIFSHEAIFNTHDETIVDFLKGYTRRQTRQILPPLFEPLPLKFIRINNRRDLLTTYKIITLETEKKYKLPSIRGTLA